MCGGYCEGSIAPVTDLENTFQTCARSRSSAIRMRFSVVPRDANRRRGITPGTVCIAHSCARSFLDDRVVVDFRPERRDAFELRASRQACAANVCQSLRSSDQAGSEGSTCQAACLKPSITAPDSFARLGHPTRLPSCHCYSTGLPLSDPFGRCHPAGSYRFPRYPTRTTPHATKLIITARHTASLSFSSARDSKAARLLAMMTSAFEFDPD